MPFRPLADRSLLELPLPSYSPLPLPYHPSYAIMLGSWYFRLGESRFRGRGAPLVLVFHLTDLSDPVPDELLPGWKARLFTLSHVKLVDSDRGWLTPGWWYPYGDTAVDGLRGLLGALYADGVGARARALVEHRRGLVHLARKSLR